MKTLFHMGHLGHTRDIFSMGQAAPVVGSTIDPATLCPQIATALKQYETVATFQAKPNYRVLLGTDADRFDAAKAGADALYTDVLDGQGPLCQGGFATIGNATLQSIQNFIQIMPDILKIVTAHSVPGTTAVKTGTTTSSLTSNPLMIGAVAVAAVLVAVAVFKK